jgi:hypothetical protein
MVQENKTPTTSYHKADTIMWLQNKRTALDPELTENEPLQAVRLYKPQPIYTLTQLCRKTTLLCWDLLPHLNPTELVWDLLKKFRIKMFPLFTYRLWKKWHASLSEITNEKWINGYNHVKKPEHEIMEEATGNTPNIRTDGSDEERQCHTCSQDS